MKLLFHNKRISGILTVLPEKEVLFEDEMDNYNFSHAKISKIEIGYGI